MHIYQWTACWLSIFDEVILFRGLIYLNLDYHDCEELRYRTGIVRDGNEPLRSQYQHAAIKE